MVGALACDSSAGELLAVNRDAAGAFPRWSPTENRP